jgi:hypothetical protein
MGESLTAIAVFSNMQYTLMYMATGQRSNPMAPCSELETLKHTAKKKFITVAYVPSHHKE